MTNEKLETLNDLSKQIIELENIIKAAETQPCEWIEFTFGNGSNRACVCNDKSTILYTRDLLVRENEKKLTKLKEQFNNL